MKESVKMSRKLIIDGNAVYELDENCMLKKKLEDVQTEKNQMEERRRTQENLNEYKRMLRTMWRFVSCLIVMGINMNIQRRMAGMNGATGENI